MKNLCLVCKGLQDVVVKQLYRRVELDIGSEADLKLSALLGRGNPGLEHIRSLILNPDTSSFPPLSVPHAETPPPPPIPPNLPGLGPPPGLIVAAAGLPLAPPPPAMSPDMHRHNTTEERKRRWSPAHFTVRLLIDLLPKDILEKFRWVFADLPRGMNVEMAMLTLRHRWTSYEEFSVDNFVLLCKKQKNLRSIEVGPSDRSLKEALSQHPDLIKNLTQLHALDLYPDNLDCLEACHKIMQDTPALDELWIESGLETPHQTQNRRGKTRAISRGSLHGPCSKTRFPFPAARR